MSHFTDPACKPESLPVWFHSLPAELTTRQRWVCWSWAYQKGAWRKPPYHPVTDAPHYLTSKGRASFAECWERYNTDSHVDGVGLVLAAGMGLVVLEPDHCRDPESGQIEPWALALAQRFNSYCEISASGTGIHILCWGTKPVDDCKISWQGHEVECYSDARYITMTGHTLPGLTTIQTRHEELIDLFGSAQQISRLDPARGPDEGVCLLPDEVVIKKAIEKDKYQHMPRLWQGDISGFPYDNARYHYGMPTYDHSEADFYFCQQLVYWTSADERAIDRIFRLSGLYRNPGRAAKWDDPRPDGTYGLVTIRKAIDKHLRLKRPLFKRQPPSAAKARWTHQQGYGS